MKKNTPVFLITVLASLLCLFGLMLTVDAAGTVKPQIVEYGDHSISLLPVEGYEYSLDGVNFRSDPVFTGLSDDRFYICYQRPVGAGTEATASLPCSYPPYTNGKPNGGDTGVNRTDAIYVLYFSIFGESYPVNQGCDYNGDGFVDSADARHLLMYSVFPDDNPLNNDFITDQYVTVGNHVFYVKDNRVVTGIASVNGYLRQFSAEGIRDDSPIFNGFVSAGDILYYARNNQLTVNRMAVPIEGELWDFDGEGSASIHIHHAVDDDLLPPTCIAAGEGAGSHCDLCGQILSGHEVLAKIDHTPVPLPDVPATCESAGLTGGTCCSVCQIELTPRQNTAPLGHIYQLNGVCPRCHKRRPDSVDTYTRVNEQGIPDKTGGFLLFGSYPSSQVTDAELIKNLNRAAGDLPTADHHGYFAEVPCYADGRTSDALWYVDVTLGNAEYRGVYLSKFRANWFDHSADAENSNQDDHGFSVGSVYWFRFEPIRFRIVTERGGQALLLAENIIDCGSYYFNSADVRKIGGRTITSGVYGYSDIRDFLNGTFLFGAFNARQRAMIVPTKVDNSARSTNPADNKTRYNGGKNPHSCEDTEDLIFLLSLREATDAAYHMDSQAARQKVPTDYALSQNAWDARCEGGQRIGWWWLRSPYASDGAYIHGIDASGGDGYRKSDSCGAGIVPALWVTLDQNTCSHFPVPVSGIAAACTKNGLSAGSLCRVCHEVLTEQQIIPALGHSFDDSGYCVRCHLSASAIGSRALRVNTKGEESETGGYILFGSYPQTEVTDAALTAKLNQAAGALPTGSNPGRFTDYGFYANGKRDAYMWYQDVTLDGERYRGVYMTAYRPMLTDAQSIAENSYQDDNGYFKNRLYWFRFDQVRWRILENKDGSMLLSCDSMIDASAFNASSDTAVRIDGCMRYPNEYASSDIRAWLNETFFDTCFNDWEKQIIEKVTLDNGMASANPKNESCRYQDGINRFISEDTTDYVFLLSLAEATDAAYGFPADPQNYGVEGARVRKVTDYGLAMGIWNDSESAYAGYGCYYLRSPDYIDSDVVLSVYADGYCDEIGTVVTDVSVGVVPAIRITFGEGTKA